MNDGTVHLRLTPAAIAALGGALLTGIGTYLPWVANPTNLLFYPGGVGSGLELITGIGSAVLAAAVVWVVALGALDLRERGCALATTVFGALISALVVWTASGMVTDPFTVLAIGTYVTLLGGLVVLVGGAVWFRGERPEGSVSTATSA